MVQMHIVCYKCHLNTDILFECDLKLPARDKRYYTNKKVYFIKPLNHDFGNGAILGQNAYQSYETC